jgi:beta-glucosidase
VKALSFPPQFVFGVATSAYQVDGHLETDWSEWERAGKLHDPACRNGAAVEHWARFYDDISLISNCGATAYRLSLEWARLEPHRGRFDEAAWAGTRERLEALKAARIRPVVTLHHFTHPTWFHQETPWHEPTALTAWERFVRRCVPLLRGLNAAVVTINEPNVLLMGGYLASQMPPGISDGPKAFAAFANLTRAHVLATRILRDEAGIADIGIAQNMLVFRARRQWHPLDHALARLAGPAYNHAFLDALHTGHLTLQMPGVVQGSTHIEGARDSMSFIGINYYTRAHLKFTRAAPHVAFEFIDPHRRGLTDLKWEWYPEGFRELLLQLKRYRKPIWVTENGLDDRSGARRSQFLYEHLRALLAARAEGAPVEAYFHWSLLDNFEWLEGWGPRFGLYAVDRNTMARRPTPAVDYFRGVATQRHLQPPEKGP